jgi:hypothetical protein
MAIVSALAIDSSTIYLVSRSENGELSVFNYFDWETFTSKFLQLSDIVPSYILPIFTYRTNNVELLINYDEQKESVIFAGKALPFAFVLLPRFRF